MNKSFILLTFIFFYSGFLISGEQSTQQKRAILEKLHWIIERSDVPTVRKEFQKICGSNQFPSMVSGLKDGIYSGSTPEDDYGYRHEISFEMKGGKMISVDYDEIHRDGHSKRHDAEYRKQMMKSGTTPAMAYPSYESQMLEKQDFSKIDGVTGATYSLYRFRLAVLYAILNSGKL